MSDNSAVWRPLHCPAGARRSEHAQTGEVNDERPAHFASHFWIMALAASSQPFSALSPAMFVAAMTAKFLSGASHMTRYHMVLEPLCMRAFPSAHSRSRLSHPNAYSWPAGGVW